jgi:hypothetical protein
MEFQRRLKMIIKDRKLISKHNGKKGGRPIISSSLKVELPNVNLVILTPNQYTSLIEKYGCELLEKALIILDKWLASGGKASEKYIGKNNYAHFRADGWVINSALHIN